MQIITWGENNNKGNLKKKEISVEHMIKETRRPIKQYNLSGDLIKRYESLSEAAHQTKSQISCISQCCNGIRKIHNKFI